MAAGMRTSCQAVPNRLAIIAVIFLGSFFAQYPGVLCACKPGWTGDDCKTDIDECRNANNTCGLYSQCNNTVGSYSCSCLPGFSGDGRNCKDIDECAAGSHNCDPKLASCSNQMGRFECTCHSGYYGNGTVCYETTMLPTTDATLLLNDSPMSGQRLSDAIRSSTPFIIGQMESSFFRIDTHGFMYFSDKSPSFSTYYPESPYRISLPIVMPYWTRTQIPMRRKRSLLEQSITVHYELMDSSRYTGRSNWKATRQIVERFTRTRFEPLTVLIVTWHMRIPSLPYTMEIMDCGQSCLYGRSGPSTKGWESLCKKWCEQLSAKASIEFQAIVTHNGSHAYSVFNYGTFQMPILKVAASSLDRPRYSYMTNLYAVAGFTDGYSVGDELPFSRSSYDWPEQHNMVLGNTGRHGQHVMQLSSWYSASSDASKCLSWLAEAERAAAPTLPCSDCPFDFRTAVLDRRYSAYEFSCTGTTLHMCFTSFNYRCTDAFGGRCSPAGSWRCEREQCQHMQAPRCCYRMTAAAGSDLHRMCTVDMPLWSLRGRMRLIVFDMRSNGYLVSLTSEGAGHAMVLSRNSTSDSVWPEDTLQYRKELYGHDVCGKADSLMSKFGRVRPLCTSNDYSPPEDGFQRGDPHLSTLGNASYTFNGHCEYHLLMSNEPAKSPPLWLQGRTSPVRAGGSTPPSGVGGGATAFVAFALKSGVNSVAVAVVRNDTTDDMDVVTSDGKRLGGVRSDLVARGNATRVGTYKIEAADSRSVSVTDEIAGVSVTVSMETQSLKASVQVDSAKFQGDLDGLLGSRRKSGGFKLRTGTVLPAGSSERQLFNFGTSWRLTADDASYLPYPPGKTRADFCNVSFTPTFAEDYRFSLGALFGGNSQLMADAEKECRKSGGAYLSCMFDAAQLRSLDAALDATKAAGEEAATRAALANRPPEFQGNPAKIRVDANSSVEVAFNLIDRDGDTPDLIIDEAVGGVARLQSDGSSSGRMRLTWQAAADGQPARLRLLATDAAGGVAAWTPTIELCACVNGGTCCFDCKMEINSATTAFHRIKCKCPSGFTGDRCEIGVSACTSSDCSGSIADVTRSASLRAAAVAVYGAILASSLAVSMVAA